MLLETPTIAPVLPAGPLTLKYLFGALLEDGTEYFQTAENKSPFTRDKNAYYELLEHKEDGSCVTVNDKLVTRFDVSMFQLADSTHRYTVDLSDGHFEIQHFSGKRLTGAPFYIAVPPHGAKLKLFYFLRRRQNAIISGVVQEDGSIDTSKAETVSQECEYHFGWETEDKKHKAEMILV